MRLKSALAAAVAVGMMGAAGAAQACPQWQLAPAFGQIPLTAGFLPDPYQRNVTAGGGYYLPNCGFAGAGWVAAAPDFDLYYDGDGRPVTIRIQSNADTVLLVYDPIGRWFFSDDAPGMGLGAAITIYDPVDGLYDIWIGTYSRASGIPALLEITER